MEKVLKSLRPTLWIWLLIFLSSLSVFSQSNQVVITWDSQVACREYGYDGKPSLDPKRQEAMFFSENANFGPCLQFCAGDPTTFTITGTQIASVSWNVAGAGHIVNTTTTSTQATAKIEWLSPQGHAQVFFDINFEDGDVKKGSLCVDLTPSPKANFEVYGQGGSTITVCLGTPISFLNTSSTEGGSAIVSYEWDFGNGDYAYEEFPVYAYNTPGNYNLSLLITNECGCTSSVTKRVVVKPQAGITIECPAVVCEDAQARYSVSNHCGGHWEVDGGTIISQTPTNVEVIWNNVDRDTGFGYVHYFSDCGCGTPTTVRVPVINTSGKGQSIRIQGDDVICLGSHARYSLPQWPSTAMTWTITPITGAPIIYTDQRNEVIVKGLTPGVYSLVGTYNNTLLNCGGASEPKYITVLDTPVISGPQTRCAGTSGTYTTAAGTAVQWKVWKDGAVVHSQSGISLTYTFPSGGLYSIVAGGSGLCEGVPHEVFVNPKPPKPANLVGTLMVCSGKPYEYTVANLAEGTTLEWQVTGGVIQGSSFADTITVVFNATGPYALKVRSKSNDGMACFSDWITFSISPMNPGASIVNTDNLTTYCPSSYTGFRVNVANGYDPQHIEWEFVPQNFGNIIGGQNTDEVQVSLNEISGTNVTGQLVVKLTNCNQTTTVSKSITLFKLPTLTFPTGAVQTCSGDNFTLSFISSIPINTAQVTWTWSTGETFTQNVTSSAGLTTITSPTMSLTNTGSTAVTRSVEVSVAQINSCNGVAQASRTVKVNPKPTIHVTPAGPLTVCTSTGAGYPITLNASVSSGTVAWYRTGVSGAIATGTSLTLNVGSALGSYYAVVTAPSPNPCKTTSNAVLISENCNTADVCDSMPNQTLTLSMSQSNCNTFVVTGSHTGTGTVSWIKSQYLTQTGSTANTRTYTTSVPGYHHVTYKVTYNYMGVQCVKEKTIEIYKPYEADFLFDLSCPTTGNNRNVILTDNSEYEGSDAGVTYKYYRNNVLIPGATTKNFTQTNVAPGTYSYRLEIVRSGQLMCSKTKTVTVKGKPNALFTVTHNPQCKEIPVVLTQVENDPNYTYVWTFGNPETSFIGANPDINLPVATNNKISLTVTDSYGCTATHSISPIVVSQANFGILTKVALQSGTQVFCEGGAAVLKINNATGASSYQWMKGSSPISGATSATYTATETGDYWAKLYDAQGCFFSTASSSIGITVKTPPTVNITAPVTVCFNEPIVLDAVVSDNSVQRRWLRNGVQIYGWSATTPLSISQPLGVGTYTYKIEVRNGSLITACVGSATTTVVVHAKPAAPTLTYQVLSCMPYRVKITASGGSGGTYNWSNGATGNIITVKDGGAYSVSYTNANGCSNTAEILIPKIPEAFLWEVPTGCVNLCHSGTPYLLGPWLQVSNYQWKRNNATIQAGTGSIPSLPLTSAGVYQLSFTVGSCMSTTDPLYFKTTSGPCNDNPVSSFAATTSEMGAREAQMPAEIRIHPNPTSALATLEYEIESEAAVEVQVYVYNAIGVQLWSGTASGAANSVNIPVDTLPVGQYLVTMYVNGTLYYENTIIKN